MKPDIPSPHIAFFMEPGGEDIITYEMNSVALENKRRPSVMKFVDLEALDMRDIDGAALLLGRMVLGRLALMYPEEFAKYPRLAVDVRTLKPPPYRPDAPGDESSD